MRLCCDASEKNNRQPSEPEAKKGSRKPFSSPKIAWPLFGSGFRDQDRSRDELRRNAPARRLRSQSFNCPFFGFLRGDSERRSDFSCAFSCESDNDINLPSYTIRWMISALSRPRVPTGCLRYPWRARYRKRSPCCTSGNLRDAPMAGSNGRNGSSKVVPAYCSRRKGAMCMTVALRTKVDRKTRLTSRHKTETNACTCYFI